MSSVRLRAIERRRGERCHITSHHIRISGCRVITSGVASGLSGVASGYGLTEYGTHAVMVSGLWFNEIEKSGVTNSY